MERLETRQDDLHEGDAGPPWSVENLTRTMFVRYAGASGDFNPLHHDDTFAQALGYPSVFAPGMFGAGLVAHYLMDWLGTGSLRKFSVSFRKQAWPGDTLMVRARVVRKYVEGGEVRVDVQADLVNQRDEVVIEGAATAAPASAGAAGT